MATSGGEDDGYRRLGFEDVGPSAFGRDDCLVMRYERARWEARRHAGGPERGR